MNIFSFLQNDFMVYALVIGLLLSVSAALLSPFLVLNRQAMIADGLSHVAFTGIIIGLLTSSEPLYVAVPFTILASLAITYLGQIRSIEYDSSIGVISAFSLAVGLIIVSKAEGFSRSIESLLVGSILTVTTGEIIAGGIILLLIVSFILVYYRPLLSLTYDATYTKTRKRKIVYLKYLLSALTGVFIVIGIRSVGMLLMSAFIIFPSLIVGVIARSFRSTMVFSAVISIVTVFIGIAISYYIDIPTGPTIVVLYTLLLLSSITFRKLRRE